MIKERLRTLIPPGRARSYVGRHRVPQHMRYVGWVPLQQTPSSEEPAGRGS
jgi:hypothetical protein